MIIPVELVEGSLSNMFQWLVLATLVAVCASEPEVVAEEAANPVRILGYNTEYGRNSRDRDVDRDVGRDDRERGQQDREGHGDGPQVRLLVDPSKLMRSHSRGQETKAEKIIRNVYSPDYYEPTWILDYRYQKTGGRDYTRGDGGQILILPKHVSSDEHTEHDNFDQLLEFLRIKQLSEAKAHLLHPEEGRRESHGHREEHRKAPLVWQKGGWV